MSTCQFHFFFQCFYLCLEIAVFLLEHFIFSICLLGDRKFNIVKRIELRCSIFLVTLFVLDNLNAVLGKLFLYVLVQCFWHNSILDFIEAYRSLWLGFKISCRHFHDAVNKVYDIIYNRIGYIRIILFKVTLYTGFGF